MAINTALNVRFVNNHYTFDDMLFGSIGQRFLLCAFFLFLILSLSPVVCFRLKVIMDHNPDYDWYSSLPLLRRIILFADFDMMQLFQFEIPYETIFEYYFSFGSFMTFNRKCKQKWQLLKKLRKKILLHNPAGWALSMIWPLENFTLENRNDEKSVNTREKNKT